MRPAPSVGHALAIVVALTVLRLGTMIVLFGIDGEAPMGSHPLHWLVMAVHAALVVALVFFGALRPASMTPADMGWSRFVPARDLPWAIVALLVAAAFPIGATLVDGGTGAVTAALTRGPMIERIAFCVVGFLAALGEESVFRGFLQPALARKMPWPAALAVTCVVFSLYHLPRHPFALLGRVLTGLAYGGAAQKTGALWAGAIAHFLTWALLGNM